MAVFYSLIAPFLAGNNYACYKFSMLLSFCQEVFEIFSKFFSKIFPGPKKEENPCFFCLFRRFLLPLPKLLLKKKHLLFCDDRIIIE